MSQLDNPFRYFFYARERWGTTDAIRRTWEFFLHPRNGLQYIKNKVTEFRLVDRREKRTYARTVYAIDRDGDLYLVECPSCHNIQSVQMHSYKESNSCHQCGKKGETHFHCYKCSDMGFNVWLEDGLREIRDWREGNVPLPSKVVWSDNGKINLGITKDAPWWWWSRREIYRDLQPNGKDGHGHYPYKVWSIDPEWTKSQMMSKESCDTERTQ